jgi:uncharacterized repeat protein (TIGR03943 family)
MSASLPASAPPSRKSKRFLQRLAPWLDVAAILCWGSLFLKYWLTQKLNLLIHPDYTGLVIAGGFGLLLIGSWRGLQLLNRKRSPQKNQDATAASHVKLFPLGWSSLLLIVTALIGLTFTPRIFNSQAAIQRGVTDTVAVTRSNPQAFRSSAKPEERTLIDWIRTLNVYPEPDSYTGQKVNVQGFVIHSPNLAEQYLLISRFVITCCAADAYPVSLPVKLSESRNAYPPDTWLQIEGQMITEVLDGKRQLTIEAKKLSRIPEPQNPYDN